MAVTTQGYRASVMPTFTPVDPALAAFNPAKLSEGILSSFKLAQALEKVKAERAREAELEATRAARIEAENAKNILGTATSRTGLGLIEPQFNYELEKYRTGTPLLGKRAALETKTIEGNLGMLDKRFAAEGSMLDQTLALTPKKTELTLAEIEQGLKSARPKGEAERAAFGMTMRNAEIDEATFKGRKEGAVAEIGKINEIRNKKFEAEQAKLDAEIMKADTDYEMVAAIKRANLAKTKAETDHLNALADYYEAGGRKAPEKADIDQISTIALAQKRLSEKTYRLPNGKSGTLDEYRVATRDAGGKIKVSRFGHEGFSSKEVDLDQEAEKDILMQNALDRAARALSTRFANRASGLAPSGPTGTPPPSAINYLRANPNMKAQFDEKYGAGSADKYLR